MKIKILFVGPFPNGMASSNRVLSYAIGLAEGGYDIEILLLRPSENKNKIKNIYKQGNLYGVKYKYLVSNLKPSPTYFNIFYVLLGIIKTFFIIKRRQLIIVHISDKISILHILFLKLFKNVKAIWVRDEKPSILKNYFWRKIINYSFSGFFFITNEIKEYSIPYLKPDKKIFILPITINFKRFDSGLKLDLRKNSYFCYVGLINIKRDGFSTLIKSFLLFKQKYNMTVDLICIGDNNSDELKHCINQFLSDPNFDSIHFIGIKRGEELIQYMKNATGLITTPAIIDSLGFPSKLAEYLASGVPVITTNAGEISKYLSVDSAYLCEPDNIIEISEVMYEIVSNPDQAAFIGNNGYLVAKRYFHIQSYIPEIKNFINQIVDNK